MGVQCWSVCCACEAELGLKAETGWVAIITLDENDKMRECWVGHKKAEGGATF